MNGRSSWNKGIPWSKESRDKMSASHLGKKRGPHSAEHIEKIRASNLGQKRSIETRQRVSEAGKGRLPWNKGIPRSKECRDKISAAKLGKKRGPHSKETRDKISAAHMGKKQASPSEETKRKMRIAHVANIKKNYGIAFPSYNLRACQYFLDMDNANETHGRYAVFGGGEVYVEELGYWLDYINYETKTIIEWYESHHFKRDGTLRTKDAAREKAIRAYFPDYIFMAIRQEAE